MQGSLVETAIIPSTRSSSKSMVEEEYHNITSETIKYQSSKNKYWLFNSRQMCAVSIEVRLYTHILGDGMHVIEKHMCVKINSGHQLAS